MAAMDLLDTWDSPHCAAGVVGGPGRTVLAVRGDAGRLCSWASVTKLLAALAVLVCAALSGRDFGPWAVRAWPALADAVVEELSGGGR